MPPCFLNHNYMKKKLTFLLLICTLQSWAQWVHTGPETGFFNFIENNGILYSTNTIGLYKSTDNGNNWNRVSSLAGFSMKGLVFTANRMLAATNKGVFYSVDNGISWTSSSQGFSSLDSTTYATNFIYKLSNGRIITSTSSKSYYSDDEGHSWIASSYSQQLVNIVETGSSLISSDGTSIISSTDNGVSWQTISTTGISNFILRDWYFYNNKIYAGDNALLGLYESADNGQNWVFRNSGLTGSSGGNLLLLNNSFYKYASPSGLYVFDLSNNVWTLSNFSNLSGYASGRYFGVNLLSKDGLVFSDDNGSTWQDCNGIKCMIVQKLSVSDQMYALWNVGGFIYDSTQTAFNRYSPYNQNFSANTYVQYSVLDIKKRSNGTIYLGTPGGVWKSTNNGASYSQSYNGLPALGVTQTRNVYDMFITGSFPNDTLYAATDDGIYYSIDEAQTFMLCAGTSGAKMQQFLKYNGVLYCAGTKIYKLNTANNWAQFAIINTTGILGFAATDGYFFVATTNNTLKYSPISGSASFTPITSGSPGFAYSVAAYDTLVFYYNETGVWKLNTSLLGSATPADLVQIAPDLPFYRIPSQAKRYSYLSNGFSMAVFNGKLWLGTNGMSTFYRSLNDFGYSITVKDKEKKTQQQSLVFPNPAKDKITFIALEKGCQINIYNCSGQVVLTKTFVESPTIDIAKLNAGIYTYAIIDTNEIMVDHGKFVKE